MIFVENILSLQLNSTNVILYYNYGCKLESIDDEISDQRYHKRQATIKTMKTLVLKRQQRQRVLVVMCQLRKVNEIEVVTTLTF